MKGSCTIRFNRAHYPVTVLGPGRRLGLWLQGCSIGCAGCISQDTWSADPEFEVPVEMVLNSCRDLCGQSPDGVTISGGEPFDQPEALLGLLEGLHDWRIELTASFDILCFSGYTAPELVTRYPEILKYLDVLIAGPYVEMESGSFMLRGSANQTVDLLTPLGRDKWQDIDLNHPPPKSMQVLVDEDSIWCIGIPGPGDMEKLRRVSEEKGLIFKGVSW